jgi:F0F1-type ATP synthase assembly protein I
MTGPEESHSSTRPISVAELLARNGTIGAPPVGGRRRRRRGNSDSVSVAELTGEIPIVTADTHRGTADPATDQLEEVRDDYTGSLPANGANRYANEAEEVKEVKEVKEVEEIEDLHGSQDAYDIHDDYDVHDAAFDAAPLTDEEADYAAHLEEREAAPLFFEPPARRPQYGLGPKRYPGGVGAEEMSPDPLDVDDDDVSDSDSADMTRPSMAVATAPDTDADELPSYLRSSGGTLFGGDSVADDLARRNRSNLDDREVEHDDDVDADDLQDSSAMSAIVHGALVVGQCILAVLFGAGLFIGFDQLWKWNNIVALVLSVLVILGLVVGVRVVRKTEDIGSTLIAVAVGALVTLGPLALLQSG